jgi:hypothetical protein
MGSGKNEMNTRPSSRHRSARWRRLRVLLLVSLATASLGPILAGAVAAKQRPNQFLSVAEQGVRQASVYWGDARFHWYNELLHDTARSPEATIWGIVPLFEAVDYDALAAPSAANLALVRHFASKAETYWDRNITPAPGVSRKTPAYAPYPGSHSDQETFFDDNAWWSLAFMDAYRAMVAVRDSALATRYLHDAERGFNFILANGWDHQGGGMWWNTYHRIPGGLGRSGEALSSATELASRLYQATGKSVYLRAAEKYITWANHHLLKWDGSYANAISHEVVMPHDGEGAMIAAFATLCQSNAGRVPRGVYSRLPHNRTHGASPSFRLPARPSSWCSWADAVAHHTAYGVNPGGGVHDAFFPLREGPQWDAIYVRGLLSLYAVDHEGSWYRLSRVTAQAILHNARVAGGLFLKTWQGGISVPGAAPGELRTDAASVSVFAALAAATP